MNEVIIDTSEGFKHPTVYEESRVIDIYDKHPLLGTKIPEYTWDRSVSDLKYVSECLQKTRQKYGGLGLAANQCGYNLRMFIIGNNEYQCTFINPVIIEEDPFIIKKKEGCLSYQLLFIKIDRPRSVKVGYYDIDREYHEDTLYGLTARCFMHEMDHLNGILFPSHAGKMSLYMAKKKKNKIFKHAQIRG